MLEMRRHYAPYLKSLPEAKIFRAKLVTLYDVTELLEVLDEAEAFYANYSYDRTEVEEEVMLNE